MKVRQRCKIVDAIQYKRGVGLEDGFLYGEFDHVNGFCSIAKDDPAALQIPYIYVNDEYIFIEEGDYIITDKDGNRIVIESQFFDAIYELSNDIESITCEHGETQECSSDRVERHEQTMESIIHRLDHLETKLDKLGSMARDERAARRLIHARF